MLNSTLEYAAPAAVAAAVVPGVIKTGGVLALKSVGFSSAGPVANTLAASWMSSTACANGGGVVAGSMYALAQSAAMTLPLVTPSAAVVGVVAAVYFLGRRVCGWVGRRSTAM